MSIADLLPTSLLQEQEWGEIVNRREYLWDTPGWGFGGYDQRISSPSDREWGKCFPFFETEQDLSQIRGVARFLSGSDGPALGALENLTNYTIGNGLTYEVESKDEAAAESLGGLIAAVQEALDDALERNQWIGDMEAEVFRRAHRDGEAFVWVREYAGQPQILLVEPDYVTEPVPARDVEDYCGTPPGLCWSFGIASDHRDMERRHGYFIQWNGSKSDWDFAPEREMCHIRLNVDRGVKRGISDFYPVYQRFDQCAKLAGNTLQGAAIQATIAYIKEHAPGTDRTAIESARNARADYTTTISRPGGGSRQVKQEKFLPGRIIDTAGTKYHAGPMGTPSGPTYVDVMQAGLRIVGARWSMPEYMISGDASNANYSSTLQAGGPFDRATQRRQGLYKRHFTEVCWKLLGISANRGRFREFGAQSLRDLKRLVQVSIDAPNAAVQDFKATEDVRKLRYDAGIMSARTWAAQADLDYDVELANGAKEKVEPSPFGFQGIPAKPGQPGQPPAKPELLKLGQRQSTIAAALESVRTTAEARAVLSECYP